MASSEHIQPHPPRENLFSPADVRKILCERGWLSGDASAEQLAFCERAAALLGPQAADANELAELLRLIFQYDAGMILQTVEAHAVLSRTGAREVVRQLALFLFDPVPFDSERFKEVVTLLKERLDFAEPRFVSSAAACAGWAFGEGELDRVVLLLDEAAAVPFAVPVKPARVRILEFCAAVD